MARATITRGFIRDLPPLPDGVDKRRIFDGRLAGFIAEQRRSGTTLYFRYRDTRGRSHEMKLGSAPSDHPQSRAIEVER
ncbi:MAG: Integrase family protein [Rhodospirillales bacterium]|nr:Integrase family protein [Rhodospirillales bacterium]